jgi:hypothetical protein
VEVPVEAVLDGKLQFLEPQQLQTVRSAMGVLALDLVLQPAVDGGQSVKNGIHSLSPIACVDRVGWMGWEASGRLNLHRANPMRSDITVVKETAARGARSAPAIYDARKVASRELMELGGLEVLRFAHDREDGQVARHADDPVQSIGNQDLANALATTTFVARQSSYGGLLEFYRNVGALRRALRILHPEKG